MGMFDYLRCEAATPDGWRPQDGLFQTKSFDRALETYTITEDGRLMVEYVTHTETVPKAERPYPDAEPGSLRECFGMVRHFTALREVADFHGYINFHGLEVTGHRPSDRYPGGREPIYRQRQYRAKFTDGRLVEITGGIADR